jgi:protein SCO1/2
MNKIWFIGSGVVIGLALTLVIGWYLLDQNYRYHGAVIEPPAQAADFTLTDQDGNPFRLSDQKGKIVLIFFGYTHCPDVCPITLAEFKQIKAMLGDKADQVRFVFVTVDPERDTPETINTFLQNFDPTFIGLTSDRATLEPVWKAYGVYQQKQDAGSAAGYLVDHSTRTYLIDSAGSWRINYPYGMEPEKIAQDLGHLMKEQ